MEYRIVKKGDGLYYAQAFTKSLTFRFSWKKKWRSLGVLCFDHNFGSHYFVKPFHELEECGKWLREYMERKQEEEKEKMAGTRVIKTLTEN